MSDRKKKSRKEKNIEKFRQHKKEIVREILYNIAYEQRKAAQKICESAVDAFYRDYAPHLYKRKYSLHEAYNIEIKNNQLVFQLGHEFMTKRHRVDNEYIYEYMFKWGWHGGANDGEGHPDEKYPISQRRLFWRQPPYDITEVDEYGETTNVLIKKWSLWDANPAKQMAPYNGMYAPYQVIKREWDKYLRREYNKMTMNVIDEVFGKYLI